MKKIILPLLLAAAFVSGCGSSHTILFGKKTPAEKYEEKLKDDGLYRTPEGRQWLAVSKTALHYPVDAALPYRQAGVFSPQKQQALGIRFIARQGERLRFRLTRADTANFVLYAELYAEPATGEAKLLQAIDTNTSDFAYDVSVTGAYVLKLQPQLFRAGAYNLSVSVGPSLLFPVADKKAYIGSVWGDGRDGGKRSHEGVDIFAPKRTPTVAASDGVIVGVREGGIGGKVVWLRPDNEQGINLYYAHLDEQLVQEGQRVHQGDTIGRVGNTGNAQHTASHLHFGVYAPGGAIDPFPFVNRQIKTAAVPVQKKLPALLRLLKDYAYAELNLKKNLQLTPVAITAKTYLAELPDGRVVELPFTVVQEAASPVKKPAVAASA